MQPFTKPVILPSLDQSDLDRLEDSLQALLLRKDMRMRNLIAFCMGWVSDRAGTPNEMAAPLRLHGQLALATARALIPDEFAETAAVSAQALNEFLIVHQDVQEGNSEREGHASVWWEWGPAQAINAGDGLHALARLNLYRMTRFPERVALMTQLFDDAILERCEADYTEIANQDRFVFSCENYLRNEQSRVGSVFGVCMTLGAAEVMPSELADSYTKALTLVGKKLGTAVQIQKEAEALWGNSAPNETVGRVMVKRMNLPVVFAMEFGSPSIKRRIGEMYMERVLTTEMISRVADITSETGAREYLQDTVSQLQNEANDALIQGGFNAVTLTGLQNLANWIFNNAHRAS